MLETRGEKDDSGREELRDIFPQVKCLGVPLCLFAIFYFLIIEYNLYTKVNQTYVKQVLYSWIICLIL